jgi:hypothetical protein
VFRGAGRHGGGCPRVSSVLASPPRSPPPRPSLSAPGQSAAAPRSQALATARRQAPRDRKCPPVGAGGAGPAGGTSGAHAPPPPRSSRPSLCVARGPSGLRPLSPVPAQSRVLTRFGRPGARAVSGARAGGRCGRARLAPGAAALEAWRPRVVAERLRHSGEGGRR